MTKTTHVRLTPTAARAVDELTGSGSVLRHLGLPSSNRSNVVIAACGFITLAARDMTDEPDDYRVHEFVFPMYQHFAKAQRAELDELTAERDHLRDEAAMWKKMHGDLIDKIGQTLRGEDG